MQKRAYIICIADIDEESCRRTFETEDGLALIAGVSSFGSAEQLAAELAAERFDVINLGYGFSGYDAEQIRESSEFQRAGGDGVKVRCAVYTINEYAKLKKAERTRSHGVIMAVPGVDRAAALFISDKIHDIRVVFVKNMTQAKHAARHLVKYNAGFIELCTWFDRLRMEDVIQAVDGAVPVGTCGDLTMQELEPEIDPEKLMPKKRVYKRRK